MHGSNDDRVGRDRGVNTPIEMMALTSLCLVAFLFIGFLGRLHAAGVEVTSVARAAAREASMATSASSASGVALRVVSGSVLARRCGSTSTAMTWQPSSSGTWQGGSVTVVVSCVVRSSALVGMWVPGSRTVTMRDTQPIDWYHQ